MKKHRRLLALGLAALLSVGVLAGCGLKREEADTETESALAGEEGNSEGDAPSPAAVDPNAQSAADGEYPVNLPDSVDAVAGPIAVELAESAYDRMATGDIQGAYDLCDERLQGAIGSVDDFRAGWDALIADTGPLQSIVNITASEEQGYITVITMVQCQNAKIQMLTASEKSADRLLGFQFTKIEDFQTIDLELPPDVKESDLRVGEGTMYPLPGKLTMPASAGKDNLVPGVILVHGSGPCDMNEAAHAYLPFRDIAYGLAEKGVAVLRYDKRSKVFPSSDFSTVETEVIEDALAAAELLRQQEGIDSSRVYIVGHSIGGMLAPRIDLEGGDFAGLVIVSGSPYTLGEVALHQAEQSIEAQKDQMTEENLDISQTSYEEQKSALESITPDMPEAEARTLSIFGMNGYYLQDIAKHDHLSELKQLAKPTFIMQGETDTQVTMKTDFAAYEKGLAGETWATLKSYPGLNHFYAPGSGDYLKVMEEYAEPALFDAGAIVDIASFIHANG